MKTSTKVIQALAVAGIGLSIGVLVTSFDTRYDFLSSETAVAEEKQEGGETYSPCVTTQSEAEQKATEPSEVKLTKEEELLLAKVITAEAETETLTGQALVGCVILNRVKDPDFPNTIEDVVFQPGEFTVISNGRFDEVNPDDTSKMAVNLIATGWDRSRGATYFETENDSTWHEDNLELLFKWGNHKFYKEYGNE